MRLDPALLYPERILEQFYEYAEDVLAKHVGGRATIRVNKIFKFKGFYTAHVVWVIKQFPPVLVTDKKGRRWMLVKIQRHRKGRGNHYYHELIFRRVKR